MPCSLYNFLPVLIDILLKRVASGKEAKAFLNVLGNGKKDRVQVGGLKGSSAAMLFAGIGSVGVANGETAGAALSGVVLFVLDDQDEAGYFYHDLLQMMGEDRVLFFPSSYRRAIKYNQKDAANGILRTEVLTRLQMRGEEGTQGVLYVVTYPDAVSEKVISESALTDNTVPVRVGDSMDLTELERRFMELGMNRTDYVYEPGQFAIRGSIVDVYSYSSEVPYRIDFFGDEVDSIRTFDVQSQLSKERVESMTVVPEMPGNGSEYVPFTDFLPKDSIVVCHDVVYVCDRVGQTYDEGFSRQAVQVAGEEGEVLSRSGMTPMVLSGEDMVRALAGFKIVELRAQGDIQFETLPQPLFHKNFELMKEEFLRLQSEGYRINMFADSEKQVERLRDIFSELAKTEAENVVFASAGKAIHEGYIDEGLKECFFTDHQIFDRYHKYSLKSDKARKGKVALTLKEIQQFEIGDYVVHMDHGIGQFGGLVRVPENGTMVEKIKITYQGGGTIYVSIHALHKVSKYKGKEGEPPRVSKLGSGAWERVKERVKTKVKDIARDLIKLYAQRRKEKGFAFSPDGYLQHALEASFLYEDTPDQLKATNEVKADMERERPMDRLVCGDVGFGKTEVAVRAAFKAATDGKQVAVLVPTTVLAYQHYQTFTKRLKEFPVRVEYLSRARNAKQQKEILQGLADGNVDIIIGTHKLISKTVKFHDLGLLIIDEEQKFGVAVKEKLRQVKVNVDTLTMTATPIPRTLQFSLMGARDLSSIQTPPPNRYPIQTEIHTFSPEVFAEAINFEMSRNGQVFIVNNRINTLDSLAEMVHRVVPDARVCIGHGRMNPEELEQIVLGFMNYDYDVMISTTIVENGIDVPNANTIIINSANMYGLSDLHQMRGRVGRSNKKAFCYLIAPPLAALPDDTRRRLQAIENFSDLGSGIYIAMQDLDIRGAGNMLGAEQSGFIADLGYEAYQKILNEAVAELRETEFAEMYAEDSRNEEGRISGSTFVDETSIESDIPAFLPEEYVPNSGERMALYRELDGLTERGQLEAYRSRLIDRFGKVPDVGEELMRVMLLKWMGKRLGIEKVSLKQGRMALYMPSNFGSLYYQSDAFNRIIAFATRHPKETNLRGGEHRSLLIAGVKTMAEAVKIMEEMENNG